MPNNEIKIQDDFGQMVFGQMFFLTNGTFGHMVFWANGTFGQMVIGQIVHLNKYSFCLSPKSL